MFRLVLANSKNIGLLLCEQEQEREREREYVVRRDKILVTSEKNHFLLDCSDHFSRVRDSFTFRFSVQIILFHSNNSSNGSSKLQY